MSKMLDRLKTIIKGEAKSESPVVLDTLPPVPIQKEQGFFATKNNLMDFEEEAPAIVSSNLSAHERYVFPIEVEYKGYYLQAEDQEQFNMYADRVDKGETQGLWTVAEFSRKYLPVLNEEVERYENDIENMPAFYKQLPKPNYPKSKTAKLVVKQVKVYSEDNEKPKDIPLEEGSTSLVAPDGYHIAMAEVNKAYYNRPDDDNRKFGEFRDAWKAEQKEAKITKAMNLLKGEEDANTVD